MAESETAHNENANKVSDSANHIHKCHYSSKRYTVCINSRNTILRTAQKKKPPIANENTRIAILPDTINLLKKHPAYPTSRS